jgi:hypothetical protein
MSAQHEVEEQRRADIGLARLARRSPFLYAQGMPSYTLIYARPRPSITGQKVIYEQQRITAECDDADAIWWAIQDVPRDLGLMLDLPYPALPLRLWAGKRQVNLPSG